MASVASFVSLAGKLPKCRTNLHTMCCSELIFFRDNYNNGYVSPLLQVESRRFLPKPVKNVQYKYDYRVFEDKQYTAEPLQVPRLSGIDPETRKRHNVRVSGGVRFDFYWITAYPYRPPEGSFYEERVLEVRTDPNRSAFIALLAGVKGRRWAIALDDWAAGDVIRLNTTIPNIPIIPSAKEIWPVGALKEGTRVCVVETLVEAETFEETVSTAAGSSSTIVGRRGDNVLIKLPHQRDILVDKHCLACIGRVSNPEYGSQHWGSMNMKRRMGIKQGSGLWHRKDGYCGRKVKPPPPPLIAERRPPPPDRYKFTLDVKDYQSGFGTNEFNPVLKGC